MRDHWYGDNRDLIKWGVMLSLAEQYAIPRVLQVLYYRPSEWATLEIDGVEVPLQASRVGSGTLQWRRVVQRRIPAASL